MKISQNKILTNFENCNDKDTLYYLLIHSHFNYGLVVWRSTYPTYLNKLKLLQNKAIRIVTSSLWSTR